MTDKTSYKTIIIVFVLAFLTACNSDNNGLPKQAERLTDIVDVLVLPENSSIPIGLSEQLSAEITLLDGRVIDVTQADNVNWSSSDKNIATVSNDFEDKGKVTGHSIGKVTITASGVDNGQRVSGTAQVEVSNLVVTQLQVTSTNPSVPIGLTQNLVAEVTLSNGQVIDVTQDDAITWASDDVSIASVSNEAGTKGQITGISKGTVIITASGTANGQSFIGTVEIEITDVVIIHLNLEVAESHLPIGLSENLRAIATLSNNDIIDVTNSETVQWSSNDVSIAKVDNIGPTKGMLTGINKGTVIVTASGMANKKSFTSSVQIEVTDAIVTTLRITQEQVSLASGLTRLLFAEATMSDGEILDVSTNKALSWSSSDTSIASVSNGEDNQGELSGLAPGFVTITATGMANNNLFTDSIQVEITDAIVTQLTIETPDSSLPTGLNLFLTAKVTLSDGEKVNVTDNDAISWSSSDLTTASVSNNQADKGMISGLNQGNVSITASGTANGQFFSDTIEIIITEPILQKLELNVSSVRVTEYFGVQLTALAIYSDGHSYDATATSQWHSDSTDLLITNGKVSTLNLVDGQEAQVSASYLGVESEPASVTMVESEVSQTMGLETAYTDDISADLNQQLKFRGGSVINGIYDATSDIRLAGGTGTYSVDSSPFFADQMLVNNVSYLKGFVGKIRSEEDQLQILEWDEGTPRSVGYWYTEEWSEVFIHNEVLGIIVYKSSPEEAADVTGMQFIYR
ncbi:Ig-like domain-containing protein [Vibrio algarum]|uniref:Ig-like domain-containing protein n=1 Tax=Vibrio algarum TaxID=3020714 RepID=A0ABT4YWX3_9VIBR|nr:Ig-like domain-containing protein [Vibrio sp. KJ40-1]MDB1125488.1 Ig-like domain-containing protein [Vibrio sp. KJ40-1]